MKKISKILKAERRSNSVDFLLDGAELPYGQPTRRKRPSGRAFNNPVSTSADSEAEQPSAK